MTPISVEAAVVAVTRSIHITPLSWLEKKMDRPNPNVRTYLANSNREAILVTVFAFSSKMRTLRILEL